MNKIGEENLTKVKEILNLRIFFEEADLSTLNEVGNIHEKWECLFKLYNNCAPRLTLQETQK